MLIQAQIHATSFKELLNDYIICDRNIIYYYALNLFTCCKSNANAPVKPSLVGLT